ncbi:MAG: protein kinase [Planctomycetes bacterium]|nr:protein kinase [Planctomycetota bacterium]
MGQNRTAEAETADNGFLELDSMPSMHRVGDSVSSAFVEGGSTLLDLDGLSAKIARKAADEHREDLAHGHHSSERYKVLAEIARGGMGAVLEVHDSDLDRNVAMKVLLRDTRRTESDSGSPMDSGPVGRFIAEAQLTGWLEHPNIVPVHEMGLDSQGRVYFTMKRVRGRSLRQVMDKLRQGHAATLAEFSAHRLLGILLKVCDAIAFAHSRGIVHRDLKPENIMVGQFGEVLVMDWGLAKQVRPAGPRRTETLPKQNTPEFTLTVSLGSTDADSQGTREGTISGTPAYMAPEQARGQVAEINQRTDVFCLGALLYEMLCLVPPFLAAGMNEALDQARDHRLLPPREKLERVLKDPTLRKALGPDGIARAHKAPRELVAIALRAMAEKKEFRYPGVDDFKRDIDNWIAALPVSAHRDNAFSALNKWARRNPTRAAVAMLALVFLLVGGVVTAGVKAKYASDRAQLAEDARDAEEQSRHEAQLRLAAEEAGRREAERARAEADKAARLEREKLERERREAEAMAARQAAFVPYSRATDLRSRSANFTDWQMRSIVWRQAATLYQQALALDPSFVEAHLELAGVLADLGYDEEALLHYGRADALTAAQTGKGHVEALMAYAMFDFQIKVLRDGLSANFEEVFRRFGPVKEAAEPGSDFAELAEVLVDLGNAYRTASGPDFIKARTAAAERLGRIEERGVPLWEVYTLLAIVDDGESRDDRQERRSNLQQARNLKPNLPLLTWLEVKQAARHLTNADRAGLALWDKYIQQFPYDPRGYYSRANLRFSSRTESNHAAEIRDLEAAIRWNPRYADAHKLLLHILARAGGYAAAVKHLESMRANTSGLDAHTIDLLEIELSAGTGEHERVRTLVLSALHENVTNGVQALSQATAVLLRDHEFKALLDLCNAVQAQHGAETPPPAVLFRGRALTMLARFEEAVPLLAALEQNPRQLPDDLRPVLRNWADDARQFPLLMTGNSFPAPRARLDIGRILALAGAAPELWMPMLSVDGMKQQDLAEWGSPADEVLRAIGFARRARESTGPKALGQRALAVLSLKQALEDGFLNRPRILADPYLAPLLSDPQLAKYFNVR